MPYPLGADPAAYTTTFAYDEFGNQTSVRLPTGAGQNSVYNSTNGLLLGIYDETGTNLISGWAYDSLGQMIEERDKFGALAFAYDSLGNAIRMTNSLNQVTTSLYDALGNLTNLVSGSVTSSVAYDARGREISADYGNGITVNYTPGVETEWTQVSGPTIGTMQRRFDTQGRLSGWVTANGSQPGFSYDINGRLEYETNSIGVVSRYSYDALGRVTTVQNLSSGAGAGYAYNAANRRIAETNSEGGWTATAFNPDGSVAATTNAYNKVWLYSYETGAGCCGASGASVTVTDPLGRQIINRTTPHGLPLETIVRAGTLSVTNKTTYLSGMISPDQEAEDYPAAVVDEGGHTRQFTYDSMGRLQRATDLGGNWWTNQFSATTGALTNVVSPTKENMSFTYDSLDNIKTIRFPDGNWQTNYYDAANRMASNWLPSKVVVAFQYDSAGRITNRQSSLGETGSFRFNGNDAVTTMTDNTGTTTNVYDSAGLLQGIDYPAGGSVRYVRDSLGRITNVTMKASATATAYRTAYAYDLAGNISAVTDPFNGVTRYEYDSVSRLFRRALPNGVVTTYEYDWRDHVTNIVHRQGVGAVLASIAYERTSFGEPTKITREDGSSVTLKYDKALRLTNEVYYNAAGIVTEMISYGYDASGSRILMSSDAGTFTNSIQAGYQVTQVKSQINGSVSETYGYDSGGRMTNITRGGAAQILSYNSADQVTRVTTNGALMVSYTYDATGRRVVSTNGTTVRRFLVAPTPGTDLESIHLIADGSNGLKQGYVYVGDRPLMRFDGLTNATYYLDDAMGTIVGLAGASGQSVANFRYDGFGRLRESSGSQTNVPVDASGDFRFHGAWLESITDRYHMRARDYDQRLGRFLSRDSNPGTMREPEASQPYSFAINNPAIAIDPSGLFSIVELNLASGQQFTMQTFKAATVNYARRKAISTLYSALSDVVESQFVGLLSFNFEALRQLSKAGKPFESGKLFDGLGKRALCTTLGQIDGMKDQIHGQVRVVNKGQRMGDPITNGRNCNDANSPQAPRGTSRGLSYSVPDFIIGEKPVEDFTTRSYGMAFTVGDFKFSARALYNDFVATGARKPEQFDAIVAYAGDHTYMKTALFIVAKNGKDPRYGLSGSEMLATKYLLGRRAITRGTLPLMVILLGK